MSDFVEEEVDGKVGGEVDDMSSSKITGFEGLPMISFAEFKEVKYCPTCTMPAEFCEHGSNFEQCLPWIVANCPEVLSESVLATRLGKVTIGDENDEVQLQIRHDPTVFDIKRCSY